jgi:hypothetical protein
MLPTSSHRNALAADKRDVRGKPARPIRAEQARSAGSVGAELDAIPTIATFHHCRVVGRRGRSMASPIDHLVVTPSGVWVVDAKTHYGPLEVRRSGGILTPLVEQLFINNRERTGLVEALAQQVSTVETMLAAQYPELPVRGVLCFLGTGLPWVEERIAGIPLVDFVGLRKVLTQPGDLDEQTGNDVAAVLADRVAPA